MIRTVTRALSILDCYDTQHTCLSLHEIAGRVRIPKATAFRLVNTLESAGYLVRLPNQQYCLSLKLVRLAGLVQSTLSIRNIVSPIMTEVNRQTGETVTFNSRSRFEPIVVEVVDTPAPLMTIVRQ